MDVFEDYSKALLQRVVNLTDVNVSVLSVMVTPVLYNNEIRIFCTKSLSHYSTSIFSVGKPNFTVQ